MDPDELSHDPIQPAASTPHYKNILCIEDEHFIGELYTRSLGKAGYNVKVVVDGEEGLREALTDQYDIILLDIMVPNITGIEILKKLRSPEQKQIKAKIIITTNLEQREETRKAIEKQADGYLVKANITPHELVEVLQSLEQ
jgi:CheY-like chemotaxis protein